MGRPRNTVGRSFEDIVICQRPAAMRRQVVLSGTGVGGYGLALCKLAIPCSRTVAVSQEDVGHPGAVDAGLRFLSDSFSRSLGWAGLPFAVARERASTSQSSAREARQIAPVKGLSARYRGELDSKCYRKVASNRRRWDCTEGYYLDYAEERASDGIGISLGQPLGLKFSPHMPTCILTTTAANGALRLADATATNATSSGCGALCNPTCVR
ncbi:hypothetical protein F4803DRAFT_273041 [Xylaria telfairii]|nr:hypothetical protein F4803DRAFT_273041 [Xylaria telfairii]